MSAREPHSIHVQNPLASAMGRGGKYEMRRAALAKLVDSLGDSQGRGGIALVSSKTGIDPSYVSRMLYPPEKVGGKNIGEGSVEKLDAAFPGWRAKGQGQTLPAESGNVTDTTNITLDGLPKNNESHLATRIAALETELRHAKELLAAREDQIADLRRTVRLLSGEEGFKAV